MIPSPTEASIHTAICNALNLVLPDDAFFFHVPNEGKRGWKAQREFKALGGVAGVPDIQVIYKGRAIFLEVKSRTGTLSHAQKKTAERLTKCGAIVATVRSVDEALCVLEQVLPIRGRTKI